MAKGNIEINSFYCLQCGQKSMELPRKRSNRKEYFHRKDLYCPHCRMTLNHIEIKSDDEYFDFRQRFEEGEFKNEAQESISYGRSSWVG
jgi:hypothetical protein